MGGVGRGASRFLRCVHKPKTSCSSSLSAALRPPITILKERADTLGRSRSDHFNRIILMVERSVFDCLKVSVFSFETVIGGIRAALNEVI